MEKALQGIDQTHPRILLVDDEVDICCMMANYLKRIGYTVAMASNAADAYGMVEDEQYQVIVSDIRMPGEDGISLLSRIRKIRPDIPVILMADQSDMQLAQAAIKHGAFDTVIKPPDFVLLEKIVERAVKYEGLQRLEKNYLVELEQTVAERTVESEAAAERLRVQLAERDAVEAGLEQAKAAVEAANEELLRELAEHEAVEARLEQMRIAAEAANEQLQAEHAERLNLESSLQQSAAERTSELQGMVDQLLAELAARKSAEEKLKQSRAVAEAGNEQLQSELAKSAEVEEQLEQAWIASEAGIEKLQAELAAARADAEERVEQTRREAEEWVEQARREAEERVEQAQRDAEAAAEQLEMKLAERKQEVQTVTEQLQIEFAERQAAEEQLEQAKAAIEEVKKQLQAEAAERQQVEDGLQQTVGERTAALESALEQLQAELAAERVRAEEQLQQAQAAADAAMEQMEARHAERKQEWQNVTEQLQIEFSERQAAEEQLKQAVLAAEAVNRQLQDEIAERQQLESSLQATVAERSQELQSVIEQMEARHAERKQEWQNVTEQLQVEFTERQAAEEQLKRALAATEAVNEQLQAEIAGRQQLESRLQLTVAESTTALESVIERMEAERAAERQAAEDQLEYARLAAEAAAEQLEMKLAERKLEVQTVTEQLQTEFAERQAAEELLEEARLAAETVENQLQSEIAERQQLESRLEESLRKGETLEQSLAETTEELESVSEQLEYEEARYLHAEKLLGESEYMHRSVIQADMDGFWLMGRTGCLLEVNDAYCRMSGYSEQELLAMHVNDLEVSDPGSEISVHLQHLITDGSEFFETQHRRKDGSVFNVEIRAQHPADEDGHIVAFVRDITDQKRLEESLRVCESLEQAGRDAEAVIEQLRSELAAERADAEERQEQARLASEAAIEQLGAQRAAERVDAEEQLEQARIAAEAAAEQFQTELAERRRAESVLERTITERTEELVTVTVQLEGERSERQQLENAHEQARLAAEEAIKQVEAERAAERAEAEERLEQLRLSAKASLEKMQSEIVAEQLQLEAVNGQLQAETSVRQETEEKLEQARQAAEAAAEQHQAELAERRQAESGLEQTIAERIEELATVTAQLESERSERQQLENAHEQARLAAEEAIKQVETERAAERADAEEQREQARIAAEAAAEQHQAELAERRQAESALEQTIAERTGELATVTAQLESERSERQQLENAHEQARLAAEAAIEQLEAQRAAERAEAEEQREQARLAAEAAAEQHQAELAERRQAESTLEQAIAERTQELENARGELQAERDERSRVEFRLETTAAEKTREFEAAIERLKEEIAEHKRVERGLEQTIAERTQQLESTTERLLAANFERQLLEARTDQARRAAETVIEKLRTELDDVRKDAAEKQTAARLAAETAIEQLQNELAEFRQTVSRLELTASGLTRERESLAEQLQSERAERQQVENAMEQARIASETAIAEMQSGFAAERTEHETANKHLQAECAERNEAIARLEQALQSAETSAQQLEQAKLAVEATAEQLQRDLDARREELKETSEQLQSERVERKDYEEKQERARQAAEEVIEKLRGEVAAEHQQAEALDARLQSEIAERQQVETGLEQRIAKLAAELVSSNELLLNERAGRERAEQALNRSKIKHRSIIQADMDGFWLIDRDGLLLEVNNAYCQMSGYSEQELLAMHITDLETVKPAAEITSFIQSVATDSDDRYETQHRRKDGSVFDVEIRSRLTADEDGHKAVFLQDIAARKQLEETLRISKESCEQLEQTVAQRTEELEKTTEMLQAEHTKRMQVKAILEQRIAERTEELEKTTGLLQTAQAERVEAEEELERSRAVTETIRKEVEATNQKLQAERTAVQRAKNSLERAKEFADLLFNSPLDTVHMFDAETGEMIRWNDRFAEVCGYSDEEIAQMKAPHDFYDEDAPGSAKAALLRVSAARKGVATLTLLAKSGMRIPYEYGVISFQAADGRTLLIPVGRDVTGRKTKSAILANMSREIRTETNSIINMNAFLLDTNLTKEQRHFAEIAYKGGESLLEYINDIVDFSNIEAGVLEIEKIDFDVKALLESTTKALAAKAAEKRLELSCRIDSAVPAHLKGDPKRIREVIANIASNAIEFTHKGKIVISALIDSVIGESVMLRISVKDSGSGKQDERQIALYDPAMLLEGSATRNYGDASLGLAMCKLIVDLMGGKLGVDSIEGKGTTFWFTAQVDKLGAGAVPQIESQSPATADLYDRDDHPTLSDDAKKGIRILMAEDYLTNQQVALIILNRLGYQADAVMNGLEAVAALESRNYDLVLMDCEMPKMNGFEATALIRSNNSKVFNHNIPIIALTANAFDQDRERCIDAGMNDYLTKPIRMDKLSKALDKWLAPGIAHQHQQPQPKSQPQPQPQPQVVPQLPLFEERELLEYLNGDVKYAKKVLNYVLKTFPEHVETLRELVKGNDMRAIGEQVNTMTGLVSCTFTPALQEICAKVETAAAGGDLNTARRLLPELEKISVNTLEKIRTAAIRTAS